MATEETGYCRLNRSVTLKNKGSPKPYGAVPGIYRKMNQACLAVSFLLEFSSSYVIELVEGR